MKRYLVKPLEKALIGGSVKLPVFRGFQGDEIGAVRLAN
jgi:hypothetical protein